MAKAISKEKLLEEKMPYNCYEAEQVLKDGGYIKGYGTMGRVMDKNHNPKFNMPNSDLQWMIVHEVIRRENNVYILNELR